MPRRFRTSGWRSQIRPDNAFVLNNHGVALLELKRFDEALQSLERSIASRPDYADAHSNRGNVLKALLRFDEALASYDRALMLRPDFAKHTQIVATSFARLTIRRGAGKLRERA